MEAELERVALLLTQASNLFAAGLGDQACEQLTQAADLLELLTAFHDNPEPLRFELQPQAALAAVA